MPPHTTSAEASCRRQDETVILASGATDPRWEDIKEAFALALDVPSGHVSDFLLARGLSAAECKQVSALVANHSQASGFFGSLTNEIDSLLADPGAIQVGQLLCARFLLLGLLGSGGMGEVYEAEDQELGVRVALKVMHRIVAAHPDSVRRFREEIRLARAINSPNVCRVYDVSRHTDADRDFLFFTMELLKGETLTERIAAGGPVGLEETRLFAHQMIAGLSAAHRCGIIHRDFKSSNIFICPDAGESRIVITDFGLSRDVAALQRNSEVLDGFTRFYAAPEVLEGGQATIRAEVYSLGVVLIEMLMGHVPSHRDALSYRPGDLGMPPQTVSASLPVPWQAILLKCVDPDPAKRYGSVLEIGLALDATTGASSRRKFLLLAPLLAASAYFVWQARFPVAVPKAIPSLAVLPLEAGSQLHYIANGITDRFADSLGQLPGLRVISRISAERTGSAGSPGHVAVQLKATHTLAGSLEGDRGQLRLHLELFRVGQASHLWSATYDLKEDQVAAVTAPAVRELIRVLGLDVSGAQLSLSTAEPTTNPEAYQLYLLGRFQAAKHDPPSLREGIALLERSVQADPRFALAHAALGAAYTQLAFSDRVTSSESVTRASAAAKQAIFLQSNCAQAFVTLAILAQIYEWDWAGSEANYRRAIAINPNLAEAHHWYARLLSPQKRFAEALDAVEKARILDPLDRSLRIGRGMILTYAGRFTEAVRELRLVVAEDPDLPTAWPPLSCALEAERDLAGALVAAQRGVAATQRASFALAQLGHMDAVTGRDAEGKVILEELIARFHAGTAEAGEIATVFAGWHDSELTLQWLERGIPLKDAVLAYSPVDFVFDFVRGDERYQRMIDRVYPGMH
jgi:serine/threonine-protein kinase